MIKKKKFRLYEGDLGLGEAIIFKLNRESKKTHTPWEVGGGVGGD